MHVLLFIPYCRVVFYYVIYVCMYVCIYVCMYVCARYRTALSIVRDRQALQAEFLKSVIVGILIALIFFGPSDFMLIVKMYVCMRGNGIVYYDRSGSHNYPSLYERCA